MDYELVVGILFKAMKFLIWTALLVIAIVTIPMTAGASILAYIGIGAICMGK